MGLKLSINSLYYPNFNQQMVEAHQSVMNHFGLTVNYTCEYIDHGAWMQRVMETSDADVVGLIDIDCIPLSKSAVPDLVKYAYVNKSMAGLSQIANHIPPMLHMYVSGACMFMYKPLWEAIGSPPFLKTPQYEPSQYVTVVAEENGVRPKTLYPSRFEKEPVEGLWRHSSYGVYGVGTVYGRDQFYHLFQSRFANNVELFIERCKQVVDGTFDSSKFHDTLDSDYKGNIACFPEETAMKHRWLNKI